MEDKNKEILETLTTLYKKTMKTEFKIVDLDLSSLRDILDKLEIKLSYENFELFEKYISKHKHIP